MLKSLMTLLFHSLLRLVSSSLASMDVYSNNLAVGILEGYLFENF